MKVPKYTWPIMSLITIAAIYWIICALHGNPVSGLCLAGMPAVFGFLRQIVFPRPAFGNLFNPPCSADTPPSRSTINGSGPDSRETNDKLMQSTLKCLSLAKQLRQRDTQLQAWLHHSRDTLFIIDNQGSIIHTNHTPPDTTSDRQFNNIHDFIRPESLDEFSTTLDRVFAAGAIATCDMHDADDNKWYTMRITPVTNENHIDSAIISISDITTHISEEQQLRASQQKLDLLVKQIPDLITVIDKEGTILSANHPMPHQTLEDTIGLNIYDFPVHDFQESFKDRLRRAFEQNAAGQMEITAQGMTGHHAARYEVWFTPFDGSARKKDNFLLIWRDVTERTRAEDTLRESERKYRTLVEALDAVVSVINYDGTFLFANTAAAAMLGRPPQEVIGKTMKELFPRQLAERQMAFVRKAIQSKTLVTDEAATIINGKSKWYNTRLQPIASHDCGFDSVLMIAVDISEFKRIECDLAKFRAIADEANYGMAIAEVDGTLSYVNHYFASVHGYEPNELIGKHLSIFHAEEQMWQVNKANKKLKERGGYSAIEVWHKHRNGTLFPMLMSGVLMKSEDGGSEYITATAVDITERKLAEERLLFYQAKLRRMASALSLTEEKQRRRLAGYLHDNIVQDLAVAKLKLAALREAADKTEINELTSALNQLIDNTLKDSRTLTKELVPTALYDLGLGPGIKTLAMRMQETHDLQIDFQDDTQGLEVKKDLATTLYQAVRELLINVLKHAQVKQAKVKMRRSGKYLKIEVCDEGIGFDYSAVLNGNRAADAYGLFSIKERLEYLGGRMIIKTERHQGTRVILWGLNEKKEGVLTEDPDEDPDFTG